MAFPSLYVLMKDSVKSGLHVCQLIEQACVDHKIGSLKTAYLSHLGYICSKQPMFIVRFCLEFTEPYVNHSVTDRILFLHHFDHFMSTIHEWHLWTSDVTFQPIDDSHVFLDFNKHHAEFVQELSQTIQNRGFHFHCDSETHFVVTPGKKFTDEIYSIVAAESEIDINSDDDVFKHLSDAIQKLEIRRKNLHDDLKYFSVLISKSSDEHIPIIYEQMEMQRNLLLSCDERLQVLIAAIR